MYSPGEPRRAPCLAPAGGRGRSRRSTVALIWLGVYPGPLFDLIRAAVTGLA